MSSPQHSQEHEPSDPPHLHPQSHSETKTMEEEESQNPQIPEIPQNQESPQQVIPEEKDVLHQQEDEKSSLDQNPDQQSSGKAPLTSPIKPQRRFPKRKKGKRNAKKQQAIESRLNALLGKLHPIPFIPSKILDFCSYEKLLKGLGLWEFVHVEFNNQNIRVDLIAQLVATYDPKLRRSFVNGEKIYVSRTDLARALRLPVRKEKGGGNGDVNVEGVTFSEEAIGFVEDFVSIWVLLHDDTWILPNEVLYWMKVIKDGSPEKVDWARLVWFMVEKELVKGEHLEDCYYAVHLQYLIKSQHGEVFFCEESEKAELGVEVKEEELEKAELGVEVKEEEVEKAELGVEVKEEELEKTELGVEVKEEEEEEAKTGLGVEVNEEEEEKAELGVEVKEEELEKTELGVEVEEEEEEEEEEAKTGLGVEVNEEEEEKAGFGVEVNEELEKMELSVEVEEEEKAGFGVEVNEEELGVEVKEEEEEEDVDVKVGGGTKGRDEESVMREPNTELSLGQDVEKKEEVMDFEEDEQLEEEEERDKWPLDGKNNEAGKLFLRLCTNEAVILDDNEEKKEEIKDLVDEEGDCGEEQEREDGFTGIFLQTRETSQIPFGSDGNLHDQSSFELVASGTNLNRSGPSFGRGSKRDDGDVTHQSRGGNKRLRIEGPLDNNPSDFRTIMEQMQQWMTKAKMMYEAKEQTQAQLNIHKQILLDELQKRNNVIELLHRNKLEESQKRDGMIYRLERELFMMGNIVEGYRKTLKDTQKAFAEYRKRVQLPKKPIYEDAGRGLVLSVEETEKIRLKKEAEFRSNLLMLQVKAKEVEECYAAEFEMYMDKVTVLGIRLMSISSNVEELKETYAKRKDLETRREAVQIPDASTDE